MLTGCAVEVDESKEVLRPVRFITVSDASATLARTFSGISVSSRAIRSSFKVAGTVIELPIQVGEKLPAGGLIAKLDESPFVLQAQQANASLVQAQANARNAAAAYDRIKGLYENGNASRTDLDVARAASESAAAQVSAADKAMELAELNVAYTQLTTVETCSVASVDVEVNENVGVTTQVAALNCGDAINVAVDIPEGSIGRVNTGMATQVRFDAFPDEVFEGRVVELGVAAAQGGTTFPVTVRVVNGATDRLRVGLAADVTFRLGAEEQGLLLPSTAIAKDHEGVFVYVIDGGADGRGISGAPFRDCRWDNKPGHARYRGYCARREDSHGGNLGCPRWPGRIGQVTSR